MNGTIKVRERILIGFTAAGLLLVGTGFLSQRPAAVSLSDARFNGLTRIVVDANVPLAGIDAAAIVVTKADGTVAPSTMIASVETSGTTLSVALSAELFARTASTGATVATRAFGSFGASRPVAIRKPGEPAANGHIAGSSQWTDEGWSTSRTDPGFHDPVTGQTGLYRFTDTTPNRDDRQRPLDWKDGNVLTPAHRDKTMLVLFVEFPDRRIDDSAPPYTSIPAYLDFLQGAVKWYELSSYGQFRLNLASPQNERNLGWIMMSKNAAQYPWDGQTHNMFAYVGEACQIAYDKWGIKADEYGMLLVMPASGKQGLRNGPGNINRDPVDGERPNTNLVAFVDRDKKPHYVDTALTAGNDLFRWGYRWLIHEAGHAFGFPDLYMYAPTVNGTRTGSFFYCGGWDMMGNIAGHSTDYLAWHKWKLRWIRDDQVDVVSQSGSGPARHFISPVETPGGSKMVVVRTGLSTAYVAEFRTRLGVNALDGRGKYSGVLIYRVDASRWESRDIHPTAQIISKQYYNNPAVGGPRNLTGVWRPVDNALDGYDSPDCAWQPGDVFSDPAAGVTIAVESISHCDSAAPADSRYTAEDVAAISVEKTANAELARNVVLSNARLSDLSDLAFDTSVELQQRIPNSNASNRGTYTYIREESVLTAANLVIAKTGGRVIPPGMVSGITVGPSGVQVKLAQGAFTSAKDAAGATVATRAYYQYGPGAPVPLLIVK